MAAFLYGLGRLNISLSNKKTDGWARSKKYVKTHLVSRQNAILLWNASVGSSVP